MYGKYNFCKSTSRTYSLDNMHLIWFRVSHWQHNNTKKALSICVCIHSFDIGRHSRNIPSNNNECIKKQTNKQIVKWKNVVQLYNPARGPIEMWARKTYSKLLSSISILMAIKYLTLFCYPFSTLFFSFCYSNHFNLAAYQRLFLSFCL